MATVTVLPGGLVRLDPNDKRVIVFDFDTVNLADGVQLTNAASTYGLTITAIKQAGVTALTFDNASLLSGNRKVQARFLATTASAGDRYRVSCKGTTNESPSQEKEYSIYVRIEEQ
jgi:hypothetical protein